jgi:hypothetical protein
MIRVLSAVRRVRGGYILTDLLGPQWTAALREAIGALSKCVERDLCGHCTSLLVRHSMYDLQDTRSTFRIRYTAARDDAFAGCVFSECMYLTGQAVSGCYTMTWTRLSATTISLPMQRSAIYAECRAN